MPNTNKSKMKNGMSGVRYRDNVPMLLEASPTAMPNARTNTTQKTRNGFAAICRAYLAEIPCEEDASEENSQNRSLDRIHERGHVVCLEDEWTKQRRQKRRRSVRELT